MSNFMKVGLGGLIVERQEDQNKMFIEQKTEVYDEQEKKRMQRILKNEKNVVFDYQSDLTKKPKPKNSDLAVGKSQRNMAEALQEEKLRKK